MSLLVGEAGELVDVSGGMRDVGVEGAADGLGVLDLRHLHHQAVEVADLLAHQRH